MKSSRRYRWGIGLVGALAAAALAASVDVASVSAGEAALGPPVNTVKPLVQGLQVGQKLVATPGTWTSAAPIGFTYQWVRSDGHGAWTPIAGAKTSSYVVAAADLGHRLFVQVKALNTAGHAWMNSDLTSQVTGAAPQSAAEPGGTSVPVEDVVQPNRLLIANATFEPASIRPGGSVVARFRVLDEHGKAVSGALVQAVGLPFGALRSAPEATTGADGRVSIALNATTKLRVGEGPVAVFVRVRKPGGEVLGGVSSRRLVKLPVAG